MENKRQILQILIRANNIYPSTSIITQQGEFNFKGFGDFNIQSLFQLNVI